MEIHGADLVQIFFILLKKINKWLIKWKHITSYKTVIRNCFFLFSMTIITVIVHNFPLTLALCFDIISISRDFFFIWRIMSLWPNYRMITSFYLGYKVVLYYLLVFGKLLQFFIYVIISHFFYSWPVTSCTIYG